MKQIKVILLAALTADGKIARDADHFPNWTGSADKKHFAEISKNAGAVIMGSKTYDTIGKPLPERLNIVLTRNKNRKSALKNLVFTSAPPKILLAKLRNRGFSRVVLAGGRMIYTLFGREHLIDEIDITISPKVFGTGISLFSETIPMNLALIQMARIDPNAIYVKYKVIK